MLGWFATKTCRNTAVTKGSNDSCTQSSACCSKQVFFAFEKGSVMRLSVLTHDVQNNSNGRPRFPLPSTPRPPTVASSRSLPQAL